MILLWKSHLRPRCPFFKGEGAMPLIFLLTSVPGAGAWDSGSGSTDFFGGKRVVQIIQWFLVFNGPNRSGVGAKNFWVLEPEPEICLPAPQPRYKQLSKTNYQVHSDGTKKITVQQVRAVLFKLFCYGAPLKIFWQTHAPYWLKHVNSCTLFTDTSPVSPT